jgi:hypothetical protein
MKTRVLVGAVIATLVIGGSAMALAGSSERRVPAAPGASKPIAKDLARAKQRLTQANAARVRCRTVGCVNRTLTRLARAVNALSRDAFECERFVNVTSYNGYLYSPDGATVFPTTALDYTQTGDAPTDRVVVYTC